MILDFTFIEFIFLIVVIMVLSYIWFRIISVAIFNSWKKVCFSVKCSGCYYLNHYIKTVKEKENGEEKQKGIKEEKVETGS